MGATSARPAAAQSPSTGKGPIGVETADGEPEGFVFGGYGRIVAGSDLEGGTPEPQRVGIFGARVVEPSYVELDLYYFRRYSKRIRWRTVTTMAFANQLFHENGEFDVELALRNAFVEAVIDDRVGFWMGSRNYRGDNIYLLDVWPLDDLNTVGAGVWWSRGALEARAHAGFNRLANDFQFQETDVLDSRFGAATITQLDRQRFLGSASVEARVLDPGAAGGPSAKVKLYGEATAVGDGELLLDDDSIEPLPATAGFRVGAQLGAWGFGPGASHVNLFARYSRGLSAFDELETPFGLAPDNSADGASELLFALGAAYERPLDLPVGAQVGAYLRRFEDADGIADDPDDGWQYLVNVRPYVTATEYLRAAIDVSYERSFPRGISPVLLELVEPGIFQVAPMLILTPDGPGIYDRPHLRLVYRAAFLNEGALDQFVPDDPRRNDDTVHFLGFIAEWWLNSSSYR